MTSPCPCIIAIAPLLLAASAAGQAGASGSPSMPPEGEASAGPPGAAGSELRDDVRRSLDDAPPQRQSITFLWENDSQRFNFFEDEDRHYTSGVELDFSFGQPWPRDVEDSLPALGLGNARTAGGLVFGQQIYTPENIQAEGLIEDDRPYAGWLYGGLYVQRANERTMDHIELDVGVVGPWSGGEATQKFIHSVLPNQFRPSGWDNQLSNELGVDFMYLRRWRTPRYDLGPLQADFIPQAGFHLGNVAINANAAVTARIGYNLPNDFGPDRLRDYADQLRTWENEDFSLYAYGRVGGWAVARDIFLDGNTFANSHSVDKKPLVGELQVGIMGRYKWFETGWAITWMTEQFDGQNGGDLYGAFVIGAKFDF